MPHNHAPREAHAFAQPLETRISVSRGRHTVHLAGELDLATMPELVAVLRRVAVDASEIVLDLERLAFIDSQGLRCILECEKACRRSGAALRLTPGTPQARQLFETTGLLHRLSFTDAATGV